MIKKVKKSLGKYLEELAKENKKEFGHSKMDYHKISKKVNETKPGNIPH